MQKIALVTDSTCDLDTDTLREYNIHTFPLRVIYKDREYRDGVDITADEVYKRLEYEVPTTSLPSAYEVISLFQQLKEEGFTHIVSVNISSGLSGTYDMIRNAAKEIKDVIIEVIDSGALSIGLGIPVLEGAKAVKNSLSFDKVVERINQAIKNTKVYFVLSTLEYLRKGGRIGHVAGIVGELLNVKPIISIGDDGKYYTYAKARGRNQSLSKLFDIVKERLEGTQDWFDIGVLHGGAEKEAEDFLSSVKRLPNIKKIYTGQISPVMGVHTGPGLIGLVIHKVIQPILD